MCQKLRKIESWLLHTAIIITSPPKCTMSDLCEYAIAAYFHILLPHISRLHGPHILKKIPRFTDMLSCRCAAQHCHSHADDQPSDDQELDSYLADKKRRGMQVDYDPVEVAAPRSSAHWLTAHIDCTPEIDRLHWVVWRKFPFVRMRVSTDRVSRYLPGVLFLSTVIDGYE